MARGEVENASPGTGHCGYHPLLHATDFGKLALILPSAAALAASLAPAMATQNPWPPPTLTLAPAPVTTTHTDALGFPPLPSHNS